MPKYQITLETTIDTDSGISDNGVFYNLVRDCCPRDFGLLKEDEGCSMTWCKTCWIKAVETGVQADARFIHVRRLD